MKYDEMIIKLNKNFKNFDKVKKILHERVNEENRKHSIYQDIIKDYSNLDVDKITDYQYSMIICDAELLSDEFILSLLPNLFQYIINQYDDPILLYLRLEKINQILLNKTQKKLLQELIIILKEIERELDEEI